jgi:hypothetical protein
VVDGRTIVMLFSDGLTKGELAQIRQGNANHVLAIRREFQRVMLDDLVAVVEDLSMRSVMAFLANAHLDPDVGIIVFLLASDSPRRSPGTSPDGTYPIDARRRLREVPPTVA